MSGAHAFLPPSGAGSWAFCDAWPTMNRLYPQDDSQESLEGTAAHWCFVELFWGRPLTLDSVADNGIPITQEMIDGARSYVAMIDQHLQQHGLNRGVLVVERPVQISSIHVNNWGTPDTRYGWRGKGLRVWDYKFGHKFVDAWENWQLIDYLRGMADELQLDARDEETTPFEVTVHQPRNYEGDGLPRTWSGMLSDLRPYWEQLRRAARAAQQPNPTATPGAHCYMCPGRHACIPLQRSGYVVQWLSQQSVPVELSDSALGNELKLLRAAAEVLKHRIGGLEADAMQRLTRQGKRVVHFAVEQAMGREGWKQSPEEVIATGRLFGVDVSKPGVLTPKQAIAAGMPAALVAPMVQQETKGLRLVEDDGRRAAKAFGSK